MPFALRPFNKKDYEAVAEIWNANFPDNRTTADEWRCDDKLFDETRYERRRYVAVDEGTQKVVGYSDIHHLPGMFHPQKFGLSVMVHPEWQRRGVGSLLYERLMNDLLELNAITVRASVREDKGDALTFMKRRGFMEERRTWELHLSVAEADISPFLPVAERVSAKGIVITTLKEERERDPDCLRKLHELSNAIHADIPMPDQFTPVSFEEFKRSFEHPTLLPDAYFIAKHSDRYIGRSDLWRSEAEPERLYQGVTGVLREYRRQGVATALKVKTIEYAKQHGYQLIATWNDSTNAGMLALNEKLGFRRQVGWITLVNHAVIVADYDPQWVTLYEREKTNILAAIGNKVVAIEHIGSTAVPGLGAKPIIDILVGVLCLADADECIEPLKSIGYEYAPEHEAFEPERRYFRKGPVGARNYHLHVTEVNSNLWRNHLLFRDYLRAHPEVARQYHELKRALAEKYRFNRPAYTNSKAPFVEAVLAQARAEKGKIGHW